MTPRVVVRTAVAADRAQVEALLRSERLPIDGLSEHFAHFIVAEAGGAVIGAVGLELYGPDALMRSVVVASTQRGTGVAQRLLEEIRHIALSRQVRALYLLTLTAAEYFAARGFSRVSREQVPETVKQSCEFVHACPASAVAMYCVLEGA